MGISKVEKEIIFLKAIKELIDKMVNYEILELVGADPDSSIIFKTMSHHQLFYILLVDLLSEAATEVAGDKITYLDAMQSVFSSPCFNSNGSVENLKTSAKEFSDWLEQEVKVEIWMPSIGRNAVLSMKRSEFIYICGNISKHNFTRLSRVAKKLCRIFERNGMQVALESALLVLDDFYDRFHDDILIYHGSTIAEFLNNIRWGIYDYLQPELSRSIILEGGDPPNHTYTYPREVTTDFTKHCYRGLMNEVRRPPTMRKFKVTRHLKLRY